MSSKFPIAGSVYSYVQRGINPHVGFIAGWLILLDYILVPSLLIVMVMNWGTALIPNSPAWLWAVVFIAFNTFVNIRGIQMSRGVDWVIFVIEVLAVIAFIALGCNFIMGGGGAGASCSIRFTRKARSTRTSSPPASRWQRFPSWASTACPRSPRKPTSPRRTSAAAS